jgi:hypothetical protein
LFKAKELGDYGPIERIFADDSEGHILLTAKDEPLREDVFIDMEPPYGYVSNTFI